MDFCKHCNDMLKITKNKHHRTLEPKSINVDDMIALLIDQYKSEASSYCNSEFTYILKFNAKQLLIVNIDEIKELYSEKSELEIRADITTLYNNISDNIGDANKFNLSCDTCSVTYHLRSDTLLDSINFVATHSAMDETAETRYDDATLFRTKNFICSNVNCITRTDMSDEVQKNKEAVFYKPNSNSHSLKYICGDCKSCIRT